MTGQDITEIHFSKNSRQSMVDKLERAIYFAVRNKYEAGRDTDAGKSDYD